MTRYDAAIFDWAGTMIDFGSFAPMGAFVEAFSRFGIKATIAEARAPMGKPKRAHIAQMIAMPSIRRQWEAAHGAAPGEAEIDEVYKVFVPMNAEVAPRYAALIPAAAAQGYEPDCLVCADDVEGGRPGPEAMRRCFELLGLSDATRAIKVDDTEPGIAEGVAVGALTIGVALSGNLVGLTPQDLDALPWAERDRLREKATEVLLAAGADHVIDTVADLPALIQHLEG